MDNKPLLQPIKIGSRVAANRFVIHSMEGNSGDNEGNPTRETYKRYTGHFQGNAGIIFLESIAVDYSYRANFYQLSIMPHNKKPLARFVSEMKKINKKALFIFQLCHSGEISDTSYSRRISVCKFPFFGGELITEDYAKQLIKLHVDAARIACDVGADGIDLKLCHGYLGSQFLRPLNNRKWKYGGSWENRSRFVYEILEKISKYIDNPDFILGAKISMWEGFPGGQGTAGFESSLIDLKENIALIKGLEERGAKFIIASLGSRLNRLLIRPEKKSDMRYLHHTFQKAAKDAAKPETVIIGCGYSTFGDGNGNTGYGYNDSLLYWGNKNIKECTCDMVGLGRQAFADSFFPEKVIKEKLQDIHWCIACGRCTALLTKNKQSGCVIYNKKYKALYKELE